MPRDCRVPEAHLRRRLESGWSYRAIARETGWAEDTIRRRCRELRLPRAKPDCHPNAIVSAAEIRRGLTQTSLTLRQLAASWGITNTAIWKRARALGLPTDRAGRAQLRDAA